MSHIEKFDLIVAEIVGHCYDNFPHRINFESQFIVSKVAEYYSLDNACAVANFQIDTSEIVISTFAWLKEAGYIWANGHTDDKFIGVTLSPKALELMKLVPESLQTQQTIGDTLTSGAKSIGKAGALSVIQVLLSEGLKLSL